MEIALSVNDDRLVLECKKHKYYFDGFVNAFVDADHCHSLFDLETKVQREGQRKLKQS